MTSGVDKFMKSITEPEAYPHIGVYFPNHSKFEEYDVIVVCFWEAGKREVYGYQLKEGNGLPRKSVETDLFNKSYVIRGTAAKRDSKERGWVRPSEDQINAFFGVSGMLWTPKQWRELRGKNPKQRLMPSRKRRRK